MWEVEFSILEEDRGWELLRLLGLEDFCFQPVPQLDKRLCDEFLSSFNEKSSYGMVEGNVMTIDAGSVLGAMRWRRRSSRFEIVMWWGEYILALLMIRAAKGTEKGFCFQYGEWLTHIILDSLRSESWW